MISAHCSAYAARDRIAGCRAVSVKPTDRITLVPVLENQGGQFSRKDFFSALARRIENATPIGARPALISVQGVAASPGPIPGARNGCRGNSEFGRVGW